jgi:hypothetical protein
VIEGIGGRESEFVRTPKHGILRPGQRWRGARYRGATTLAPLAELTLAAYFAFAFVVAASSDRILALPILGVFFAGFCYVGARSLLRF